VIFQLISRKLPTVESQRTRRTFRTRSDRIRSCSSKLSRAAQFSAYIAISAEALGQSTPHLMGPAPPQLIAEVSTHPQVTMTLPPPYAASILPVTRHQEAARGWVPASPRIIQPPLSWIATLAPYRGPVLSTLPITPVTKCAQERGIS
jgi:hypothetical protein